MRFTNNINDSVIQETKSELKYLSTRVVALRYSDNRWESEKKIGQTSQKRYLKVSNYSWQDLKRSYLDF